MAKTLLKTIDIKKFRALEGIKISFGTDVTVLCGKNGTAKSTILGIAAQIFSFDKDYISGASLTYKTITEEGFKSQFSDHFRISPTFDKPGSMEVGVEVFDGYTNTAATGDLTITTRELRGVKTPRIVVRNNSSASEGANKDRNFTHPVIFLSLRRLYPIASREKYVEQSFEYLKKAENQRDFTNLTNELLGKQVGKSTSTTGTVKSSVSHGDNYDCHSVSAGEDNVGQIILAILSFRKLQEEYGDKYKGGLLLIDEADAGLFPAAQSTLIEMLDRECKNLKLQVILTSHSVTLIEKVMEESAKDYNRTRFKTVYLTDARGPIEVKHDWNWSRIYSDINSKTSGVKGMSFPCVNVYFEDNEGLGLFNALMSRHPVKRLLMIYSGVSLGCSNYIQLVKSAKIPEFKERSVICLDADAMDKARGLDSIVILPGDLPPDQLIFEFLYNLPADDSLWQNDIGFTRPVFLKNAKDVIRECSITGGTVRLKDVLSSYTGSTKPRELFKAFYKKDEMQSFLKLPAKSNPWRRWISINAAGKQAFVDQFVKRVIYVLTRIHGVESGKLSFLTKTS